MIRCRGLQVAAFGITLTVVAIMPAARAHAQYITDSDQPDISFVMQPGTNVQPPPAPAVQPSPRRQVVPRRRSVTRRPQFRLASVPNMFGDTFPSSGRVFASDLLIAPATGTACLPLAGGARRNKIAENNKALPMDRVYFMYNHYHNALLVDTTNFLVAPTRRDYSVDKFTAGLERTFFDGLCSLDVRMPFTTEFGFSSPFFDIQGGNIGNLAVALKRSLYQTENTSVVAGLGLDLPTGSDVDGQVNDPTYTVHNDAVMIQPFIGLLAENNDIYFLHGFIQFDIPTHGNEITFQNTALGTAGSLGRYSDQTLLSVDVGAGCWLLRNPHARGITGLASIVELHYTTTLQDADSVSANVDPFALGGLDTTLTFSRATNRSDILNLTFGLDAEVGLTNFRVGAAFPLTDGSDRMFDTEIQAQINRRY